MIRVEEFHKKTSPSGEGQKKPSDLLVISTITSLTEGFFVVHPKEVVKTLVALRLDKVLGHESCFYMYQDKKKHVFRFAQNEKKQDSALAKSKKSPSEKGFF